MKNKDLLYIDNIIGEIRNGETLISNKKISDILDIQELKQQIIGSEITDIFICGFRTEQKSVLEQISIEKVKADWDTRFKNNICLDEEADLENFPNGYCFFTELWQGEKNEKILVFFHCH